MSGPRFVEPPASMFRQRPLVEGKGPPSDSPYNNDGLGPILDKALVNVMQAHPEYTRAQAIEEAMKIPHVAAAYERDNNVRNATARGSHL